MSLVERNPSSHPRPKEWPAAIRFLQRIGRGRLRAGAKSADPGGLPAALIKGSFLTFFFVPNSAALDLSYVVEAATNFTLWDAADVEAVMVANTLPPNRVTLRYRYLLRVAERAFLRLSITRP